MVTHKEDWIEKLVPENIKGIDVYVPGKPVEELEREIGIEKSIKLASNENPLGPSPKAIAAVKTYLKNMHRYPEDTGYYLRQKLAKKIGRGITLDHLILGNGSCEIIDYATTVFLSPDNEAVIADPAFIFYNIAIQYVGAKAVKVPCRNNIHDLEAMLEHITPATRLVYIANPNNPTGTIVEDDELCDFLKSVPDHVLTIVDEAYFEYIDYRKFPDSIPYILDGKKIIVLRTFSKIHGLAGFRIGYGIADPEIIMYLNKVRHPFNTTSLGQIAALAALDDEEHIEKSRLENEAGKKYLYKEFRELPIKFTETFANFILVELDMEAPNFFNLMLHQGVIVRPVGGYGLKNPVRISIGTRQENRRLVKAMRKVLTGE